VSNILCVNALHSAKRVRGADAPSISLVAVEREVVLRFGGLGGVVAEDAGPLLDGLLVVVGPVLGGGDDGALGAGRVPGCGLVGG
jgi:hypothetical protein